MQVTWGEAFLMVLGALIVGGSWIGMAYVLRAALR
jgi:hypothetical protein